MHGYRGTKLKFAQCHWSWTLQLFKQALSGNVSCYSFYKELQVWWEKPQNWPLNNSRTVNRYATVDKGYSRSSFQLSKKNSKLSLPLVRQLLLFLDDNAVLRHRGRLESAPLDDHSEFPSLLPRNEHFTKLVALAAHVQVRDNGVRETLAQLRQKYRVPRGRQVRRLVRKCVTCWKTDGNTFRPVSSPPLPPSKVSKGQAFSTTGVDYAGPLNV